jgi:hypothetical protein
MKAGLEESMPRRLKFQTSSRPCGLMHIIAVLFVFSYIAFDILDLDLSEFPLQRAAQKQVVIIAEAPNATELANLPNRDSLRIEPSLVDPSVSKESIRFQDNRILRIPWFHIARAHIHRVNFPPSSTLDSSPAA